MKPTRKPVRKLVAGKYVVKRPSAAAIKRGNAWSKKMGERPK